MKKFKNNNEINRPDLWKVENELKIMAKFIVAKISNFLNNNFREWLINSVTCSEKVLFSKIDAFVRVNALGALNIWVYKKSTLFIISEYLKPIYPKEVNKLAYIMYEYNDKNGGPESNEANMLLLRDYAVDLLSKCGIKHVDAEKSRKFFDEHVDYRSIVYMISKMRENIIEVRRKVCDRLNKHSSNKNSLYKGLKIDSKKLDPDYEASVDIYNATIDIIKCFNLFVFDIEGFDESKRKVHPIKSPNGEYYI